MRGPLCLVMWALVGLAVGATGCSRTGPPSKEGATMLQSNMHVRSAAFDYNRPIPRRFTEDGEDLSPELAWSEVPAGTKEFAIIVDDVDAVCAEIAGRGVRPLTGPADRDWGMRTATFADRTAVARVLADLERWCRRHGVTHVSELVGGAHGSP